MAAIAFRSGQKFRFPDDDNVYTFISISFDGHGQPVITYADENEEEHESDGYFLSDLVHA